MIPQLSLSLIASIKPALMLTSVTASAACSAPMTVILSSGNYPGMFPPSPGASGVWHAPPAPAHRPMSAGNGWGSTDWNWRQNWEEGFQTPDFFWLRQEIKKCECSFVLKPLKLYLSGSYLQTALAKSSHFSLSALWAYFVRRSLNILWFGL